MNYDKNSFVAGIAVGRQLKGWASFLGGGNEFIPGLIEFPGVIYEEDAQTYISGIYAEEIVAIIFDDDPQAYICGIYKEVL